MKQYVTYVRVSTKMQGLDGLGIAAQTDAVRGYVEKQDGKIIGQFAETESGAKDDRPQLTAALVMCRKTKATLLVARLDRLSRDAAFLICLQKSEVEFKCVDMPECDRFTVSLFAILAQRERELIAERTRLALQAAKKRGVYLGAVDPVRQVRLMNEGSRRAKVEFRQKIVPTIEEIKATGVATLQGIADCLNRRGIKTRTGKSFLPGTVSSILA
jgi:DNA invertase Pin-like site-specific DNA recombinase